MSNVIKRNFSINHNLFINKNDDSSNKRISNLKLINDGFSPMTGTEGMELLQSVAQYEPQTLPFDLPSNFVKASSFDDLLCMCMITGDNMLSTAVAQEIVEEVEERSFVQWMKQF